MSASVLTIVSSSHSSVPICTHPLEPEPVLRICLPPSLFASRPGAATTPTQPSPLISARSRSTSRLCDARHSGSSSPARYRHRLLPVEVTVHPAVTAPIQGRCEADALRRAPLISVHRLIYRFGASQAPAPAPASAERILPSQPPPPASGADRG